MIGILLSVADGKKKGKSGPTVEFDGMAITIDEDGNRIEVPTE